ncbi:MAG TPA: protein-L-isoaspartate O-methyltransferase [Steroidobacteraceae bacterium]|nr:protein-L-isoaspartate O-methyltransferase [Steroidobacteraceae bacterium]HRX90261.1 protein-L-isoaspartate O-methyltransferase [Steroidobacteraceae bacterium]
MQIEPAREQMIHQQVRAWDVLDDRVLDAMRRVPRERFVPSQYRDVAFADTAIPIGSGQHMLTPQLTGRLLQALAIRPGDQALEIGTGSGYVSACMAMLGAGVQSLEIDPALAAAARRNLEACPAAKVEVIVADAFAADAVPGGPFDVIAVTGSLPLYDQRFQQALKPGGRLFVVVGQAPIMRAHLITRVSDNDYRDESLFETVLPALHNAPQPIAFTF